MFQRKIEDFEAIDDSTSCCTPRAGARPTSRRSRAPASTSEPVTLAAVDGDRNGQICGFGRDSLAYQNLGMVENCRILGLEQLSDERRLELGVGAPPPKPKKEAKPKSEEKAGEAK